MKMKDANTIEKRIKWNVRSAILRTRVINDFVRKGIRWEEKERKPEMVKLFKGVIIMGGNVSMNPDWNAFNLYRGDQVTKEQVDTVVVSVREMQGGRGGLVQEVKGGGWWSDIEKGISETGENTYIIEILSEPLLPENEDIDLFVNNMIEIADALSRAFGQYEIIIEVYDKEGHKYSKGDIKLRYVGTDLPEKIKGEPERVVPFGAAIEHHLGEEERSVTPEEQKWRKLETRPYSEWYSKWLAEIPKRLEEGIY